MTRKMPTGSEVLLSGCNAFAPSAVCERDGESAVSAFTNLRNDIERELEQETARELEHDVERDVERDTESRQRASGDQPNAMSSPRISRSGMRPVISQAVGVGPNGLPGADELVRSHMSLVRQIARKYSQYQPDSFEDLVQVGSIGLLKAIKYYDPMRTRSASFRTLATCYVRGEIRHYLRDHCSLVQVPRRLTEMNTQLSQLEERLTKTLDRAPTVAELAQHSGFSVEDILEALQSWEARLHYDSLDSGADEEERDDRRSLCDVVPDKRCQDLFSASEEREVIVQALKRLGDRTRQIVEFVFFYDLSQKETAYVLGLSEMGVSRAVHSGLKRLKEIIGSETR